MWRDPGPVRVGNTRYVAMRADTPTNPYRLPRTAVPVRYDLTLSPDLAKRDFVGDAAIGLDVIEPISELVCNAKELDILKAWVIDGAGVRIDATHSLDDETERVTFTLLRTVGPGRAALHIQFRGVLNDKLVGFYASSYTAEDGSTKVIATTQMEATDARRAFPCWDEPDLKAVFGITLVVDEGLLAVSNSPVLHDALLASGKRQVTFRDTMTMSTYLVCFVVGELEATEPIDVDGVPLRVIARPGNAELSRFALEVGAFALHYFATWYGIPYPGEKLDLIATPDFAFGAMENLGAVTFRETLLLIDEDKAARSDLERIADVVSHEIAHMWFGDLVTMKWWNGLWLNEAFATFAETSCVAAYKPEWDRWTSFSLSRAMAQVVDGLHATRPIEFPVVSPRDAEGMFDVLTYEKGASVLRMLEQFLGEQRFRDGVHHYLSAHSYANAETTDLWDAIEHTSGEPVRKLMDGWIFQGGYPLIEASLDVGSSKLQLHQRRFTYLERPDAETTWDVPVLYRSDDGTVGRIMVGAAGTTVSVPEKTSWVVVNAGGHGFYRVGYDAALLTALRAHINELPAIERIQIVADAWAGVLAGTADAQSFVTLTSGLAAERDPNVWSSVLSGWIGLDGIADDDTRPLIQQRFRALAGPLVRELGWMAREGESSLLSQLRGMAISAIGVLGADADVQALASSHLAAALSADGTLDPDVVPAVISICAHKGDAATYEQYLAAKHSAATPQHEQRLLRALGTFRAPELVARTLAMTLTDEIRTQDAPYLLGQMLGSSSNGPATWAFIRANWDAILERFPSNAIPRMLEGFVTLSTPSLADEVTAYFAPGAGHEVAQGAKQMSQHLERLAVHRAFRARESVRLATVFAASTGQ